ncbi:helix-turn-helix domain-containing protein [Chryseobacterium indoltheticum]|uniref:DNA binding domain-containing protein, excisionase family n=1 Tax=Chryseobacterium indoltheticum TaxID=254 RepID=A0A381F577_9FLAO|nr:helix-turn-helix domain-containing protein [Chryseobacterium indoltheticum]AZA75142.1 DNA-binding protein [Chryseobacterium indoltheticum]SIQ53620.1 DNA binding domain-containing protein, excisionase family [Chryseobacterium indoltheticum]SUX41623.1 Helix-turn-helix domain [Chryseobacterium indoltheticum]
MDDHDISFNNLPQAVAYLIKEVGDLKLLLKKENTVGASPTKRIPIGIEEVSKLIGKAKSTIYSLVQKRIIPCYKNGKKLYFFEDELLDWISNGKRKTMKELIFESEQYKKKNSGK